MKAFGTVVGMSLLAITLAACGESKHNSAAGTGGTGGSGGSGGTGGNILTSTTAENCPPASSPGCCGGDGGCCSCVGRSVCIDPNGVDSFVLGNDPGVQDLTECVCRENVCADECDSACAGRGIDGACLGCVEEAVKGACSAQAEVCSAVPEKPCAFPPVRRLGVCFGGVHVPEQSTEGVAGAAGAAGAPGDETCTVDHCELRLSGKVSGVGVNDPPACDRVIFDPSDLGTTDLHWFEFASDEGPVTVGFATPEGAAVVEEGAEVDFSYVRSARGDSLTVESGGKLLAHATRGQQLPTLPEVELTKGTPTCDEEITEACRVARHRMATRWEHYVGGLQPGDTQALGPFSFTLEQYKAPIEADGDCASTELSVTVIRTEE
jgi:hypothetical protein